MTIKIAATLCVCLYAFGVFSQENGIIALLKEIEENNLELKGILAKVKSEQWRLKSENNLSNPELGAYYLPLGKHLPGDYTEFQINQSFEMPSVYKERAIWNDQKVVDYKLKYDIRRQEILLKVQKLALKWLILKRKGHIVQNRISKANTVYLQSQESFEKELIGILEVNKAKVAWIQLKFDKEEVKTDRNAILIQLRSLNGGEIPDTAMLNNLPLLSIAGKNEIWKERLVEDPKLQKVKQSEIIAEQQVVMAGKDALPEFKIGINYQGVQGDWYSGFFGGVQIPLWNHRGKKQAAESNLVFQRSNTQSKIQKQYSVFENQYDQFQALLDKYKEYKEALETLENEPLLMKAYRLGEISFTEYYMELQFYRQAIDDMVDMELQLYELKSDLIKHEL